MASSTGRIPQGEVVVDFADGGSYIRHQAVLETERRRIESLKPIQAQKAMEALEVTKNGSAGPSKEDVAFIVSQLGCSEADAKAALKEEGDLVKALIKMVKPRPRARSVDGGAQVQP